jgi:DNA modification methylase
MSTLPVNRILVGDATERLRQLPDHSVDQVVTSPPYFRLRNYNHTEQLGIEQNVDHWVDGLLAVLDEVARVLVPSGTLWLNLGDTYANHSRQGAARKSLLLGPERVALAMTQRGWLLRNKIVWNKTNHLPTSVGDRLACGYEVIYVFARQPRYFFDLDAVREPHRSRPPTPRSMSQSSTRPREDWRGPNGLSDGGLAGLKAAGRVGHPLGRNPGDVWSLASSNYRGTHHATYPLKLADRMIRAGCPERRCTACRAAWSRPVRRLGAVAVRGALTASCSCPPRNEPGVVLDPFMGAGTTAVAARSLDRHWLGIELNPDFVREANARLQSTSDDQAATLKEVA